MRDGAQLPHEELGAAWRALLAEHRVVHLDAAGCSCASGAVLDMHVAHLRAEADRGGYTAELEAGPVLDRLNERLLTVTDAAGASVALVPSASAGFETVLRTWPLPARARIGVLPSEYPANRAVLEALGARGAVRLVPIAVDPAGRMDLGALDAALGSGLELLTFPHVPSHRGIVQPAAEAVRRCHERDTPVLIDVAQSAGHLDLAGVGADVYVGTSRKWLRGPRGVGFVVGAPGWVTDLASVEAPVAARVGLAVALGELLDAGIAAIADRTAALGRLARQRLHGVAGWEVCEPMSEPTGIVTLRHATRDPHATQRALLATGVLTNAFGVERAPGDLDGPRLRASLHAYCDESDVEALRIALAATAGTVRG